MNADRRIISMMMTILSLYLSGCVRTDNWSPPKEKLR